MQETLGVAESSSAARSTEIFAEHEREIFKRTDRMFAALMILQWLAGIGTALWISPRTWAGTESQVHIHVWAAVLLGGVITVLPVVLGLALPGRALTRQVIAAGQMLMSALLIHLSGGRIETHFHVFGSLAFLAFYRDWRLLVTASAIVAADHVLRGLYWPQSVYGVLAAEPWRWLEHAGWVVFEDVFLMVSIIQSRREMLAIAERRANLEIVNQDIERQVAARTAELCESEQALRAALQEAKESERLKGEFLASMSHEIRTPLNGMIGMTGLLADTDLAPAQREYAETARVCADTLLSLINDILDFSKLEAGKAVIEPVAFDLQVAAQEVAELFAAKAAAKGVNLALRYAPDSPSAVVGDSGRIRQVLANLVGNAVKFTESGHVFVNIECERQGAGEARFRFSVEDTGIGISEEQQGRVFQRFTQADASTTRKYGGTGLGLAISRELVVLMGGEIGLRSEAARGSEFWFTLPLPVGDDKQVGGAAPVEDLADLRVLIVDDSGVNRRILHELILRWGMRNGGFASGSQALSALRQARAAGDPYRIALVDLNMPDMDGEMVARAIKSDPETSDVVLLLLTSSGLHGDAKRMAEVGFAAVLTKPVRPSVLMDAMQRAWAGRETRPRATLITRRCETQRNADDHGSRDQENGSVRARVLLVEDNVVNQRVCRLMLEKLGCRVDAAGDGIEAIELLERIPYDLVFMDCQMPRMDGYQATRAIREMPNGVSRIPIVAITANAMQGDRERCLAAGMNDYVSKPVRRETVQSALQRWLPAKEPGKSREESAPASAAVDLDPWMAAKLRSLTEEGGEDFVAELVSMFVANTGEKIETLRQAGACGDFPTVQQIAHGIKGSSATLGAVGLAALCQELETGSAAGSAAEINPLVERIERTFDALKAGLSARATSSAAAAARPG